MELAWGRKRISILLKIDLDGNLIFRKEFSLEENLHSGKSLIEENGNYTFLSWKYFLVGDWIDSVSPQIIKTDKQGNILSRRVFESNRKSALYMNSTHLIKNKYGGYFLCHMPGNSDGAFYYNKVYFKTLDENGSVLSNVDIEEACGYNIHYVEQILQASDGDIYLLCNHNVHWGLGPWQTAILKFSSDGQFIGEKMIMDGVNRMAENFIETPEGNLLILTYIPSTIKMSFNLEIL